MSRKRLAIIGNGNGTCRLLDELVQRGAHELYEITVFGEERGKPALSWSYLKQFIGKGPANSITIGKDIDGVTGASNTSRAVTSAVKKAVCVYAEANRSGG